MQKIYYENLNARQQEIYNFQKVSSIFADYGFTTVKLSDDWMGADFIAISFDGSKHIKVQLKGRMTFEKKYLGKEIMVCFCDRKNDCWYLYDHDELLKKFVKDIGNTESWSIKGGYSYPVLSKYAKEELAKYILR